MGEKGQIVLSGKTYEFPIIEGTENEKAIDITNLRKETNYITIDNGYGTSDDSDVCEENGQIQNADPNKVSDKARKRGAPQLGSLGSGNHFLEVQKVAEIHDEEAASRIGIKKGTITILIHCGSRGFAIKYVVIIYEFQNNQWKNTTSIYLIENLHVSQIILKKVNRIEKQCLQL